VHSENNTKRSFLSSLLLQVRTNPPNPTFP